MTTVAETSAPTSIVFGTDGWRARVAEDYTFHNVRRCADAVAEYVAGRGEQAKGVVIAYDRRFASEHFAEAAANLLTNDALDPQALIPEYKACAVQVFPAREDELPNPEAVVSRGRY